jgi:type I restriction enzyme S subunit
MTGLVTEHMPLLAAAPNGMRRVRAFILDLAVRGRLCTQDPTDLDAAALLARLKSDRASAKLSGRRRGAALDGMPAPEAPFDVPEGWHWAALGDIAEVVRGVTYGKADARDEPAMGLLPLLRGNNISGTLNFDKLVYVPADLVTDEQMVRAGDLVIAMSSGSADLVGKAAQAMQDFQGGFGAFCGVVRPASAELQRYLGFFFQTPFYRRSAAGQGKGIGINNLQKSALQALPVPVPPLAEQHRIVAKVEELMSLCDRLEAEQADAEAAHAKLVEALLASLTQARDAADFRASWQQLAEHFHTLFTTEASIDALEAAVLTLAVTGKLSSSTDFAGALTQYDARAMLPTNYERLQKQRITGAPVTMLDELPPLPREWVYRSIDHLYGLNHIVDYADGNHGSDYPTKAEFGNEGVLFLTAAQISADGSVDWGNCPRLQHAKASTLTKGWTKPGDVLLTHNATVGRTAIYANCSEEAALLGTSVTFYRVNDKTMSNEYLYLFFTSAVWFDQMAAVMRQTTRNQVSITKQALFYVSLPPLDEQLRIAAYVQPLRKMCSRLRELVAKSRLAQERLASVLVEQAVA